MQQGTKGKATVPTRCEVRNFHPLSLENVFFKEYLIIEARAGWSDCAEAHH